MMTTKISIRNYHPEDVEALANIYFNTIHRINIQHCMAQCTAKSKRSQKQCLKWAVRGRMTCHMHGGTSRGPRSKAGKEHSRLAVFKHGNYTKEAIIEEREVRELIRLSKDMLRAFGD
jgi:hypothetical protein